MDERNPNDAVSVEPLPPVASIGSSVVPILNKLQDIFAPLEGENLAEFNLPQVVVVGSQSSGKSSVLEALVGRDFLPRGEGICTRRPILLQLERNSGPGEWGEFRHLPGQRFSDFAQIRSLIQAETDKVAGTNKVVSDKEIRLKIFSPNVLNITLVDLPGMTKVPVGDQPIDIESRIKNLIMNYIKQENSIILAVSPANADLATSDALQIAKEVDPTGLRTLGVITKLDLMDKGTDARKFLLGKVVPLHLGYVGVKNRSQQDIKDNCTIVHAFAEEEKFFQNNPIYNGVSDCCGIRKLAKKLNQILEQHITAVLPYLKAELNSRLVAVVKELQAYGNVMESKGEQGAVLSNILTKYCEAFSCMVDGKSQELSTKELSGGARIKHIFQSSFVKRLEDVNPCENMSDVDIRIAIQNATGLRNSLFVPEAPFENLVRREIARLLEPSLQCLHYIHEELITISYTCEPIEMQRFQVLRRHLGNILKKFLCEGVKAADRMIKSIIDMELGYINSAHPKFIGGKKAVELALQQARVSQISSGEKKAVEIALQHGKISQNGNGLEQVTTLESNEISQESISKPEANGVNVVFSFHFVRTSPFFPCYIVRLFLMSTYDWVILRSFLCQLERDQVQSYSYKAATATAGYFTGKIRGVSNVFGSRRPSSENPSDETTPVQTPRSARIIQNNTEAAESVIRLNKLSSKLRLPETQTEDETVEIIVTKLLVTSYYDIVRKNVQDLVPKAIMHFLINYTKSNLLGTLMQTLYRENLFEDLLKEKDEIVAKRKKTNKMFHILQQAVQTLDDVVANVCFRKSSSELDVTNALL